MSEHHYIERTDSGTGVATGLVLAIVAVLLVGVVALFMFFGGPGRFVGGATGASPSNTNINVPSQAQPAPQSAPQINVPPRVDLNVNPGQGSNGSNSGTNNGSSQQAPSGQGGSSSGGGSGSATR